MRACRPCKLIGCRAWARHKGERQPLHIVLSLTSTVLWEAFPADGIENFKQRRTTLVRDVEDGPL